MRYRRALASFVVFALVLCSRPAGAYSVLSHEEVVDLAWKPQIVPLLRARFPGITEDAVRHAHAYAYGGSVIQDIGYYPFGSHYFSDLLHYVRTGDFVDALIRDSTTPDEYAFALGALAHYTGDEIGHPYVNQVTSDEYPKLRSRFGKSVTYSEDHTAHIRTEFGFDVVGVAKGFYSQQQYHDLVGFQVAKPLLERAFHETYGIEMSDVIKHEDLAIATYRFSVSHIIPSMSKVALASYHKEIEQAHPGFDANKFEYRFNRTEFNKDYGVQYQQPGFGARMFGLLLRVLPKIGPLRALRVSIPNSDEQAVYMRSINETVDRFKLYLAQVNAPPSALPPEAIADAAPEVAAAARQKRAVEPKAVGPHAGDTAGKKNKKTDPIEQADKTVQKTVDKSVKQAADQAKTAVAQTTAAAPDAAKPIVNLVQQDAAAAKAALSAAAAAKLKQPSTPTLKDLDLDTGKLTGEGEYDLADETHAHLLDDLVHEKSPVITPELREHLLNYYEGEAKSDDALKKKPEAWEKLEADLKAFRAPPAAVLSDSPAPPARTVR